MLLLPMLALAGAPDLPPVHPCATPRMWEPVVEPRVPLRPPPPDGERAERDAYVVPNSARSEHFVVRWGTTDPPSREMVNRLLDAFEDAWEVYIVGLDHSAPYGTDAYRFNVYVGDTGSGAPPGYGAAGYYSTDPEGWPMVSVSRATLDNPGYADITAVHEFYHAVQGSTRRFDYDPAGPAAWFWEATATWASTEVYDAPPYDTLSASFLFGYAFLPQRRLDFFDYPDTGALQEFHQYGAFIFPLHLDDRLDDPMLIRDVWEVPVAGNDPVAALRIKLDQRGEDFDALWLDHIARNVTWDYPSGRAYRDVLSTYAAYYPEASNIEAASLPRQGTDGWVAGPAGLGMERYGSNTLVLSMPRDGTYTLTLEGDEVGSAGTPAQFGATLVVEGRPGVVDRYTPVPFDGTTGQIVLDDLGDVTRVSVALGAWTDARSAAWSYETFPYRYRLAFEAADPMDPTDDGTGEEEEARAACGCTTGSAPGASFVPLLGLLVLARRRRR